MKAEKGKGNKLILQSASYNGIAANIGTNLP
jgi:hypothetical protein